MDGADKVAVACPTHPATPCPPADAQFRYVQPSDVQPYFQLAERYTFADRMFQTNEGPSFPSHQFIISGTSGPTATSDSFRAENSAGLPNAFNNVGCTSPPAEFVYLINPKGRELERIYPCAGTSHAYRRTQSSRHHFALLHTYRWSDLDRSERYPTHVWPQQSSAEMRLLALDLTGPKTSSWMRLAFLRTSPEGCFDK